MAPACSCEVIVWEVGMGEWSFLAHSIPLVLDHGQGHTGRESGLWREGTLGEEARKGGSPAAWPSPLRWLEWAGVGSGVSAPPIARSSWQMQVERWAGEQRLHYLSSLMLSQLCDSPWVEQPGAQLKQSNAGRG